MGKITLHIRAMTVVMIICIASISSSIAQQLTENKNDLSQYGLSYVHSSPVGMENKFTGIRSQGGSFLASSFAHKNMNAASKILFVVPEHDFLLHDWLSNQLMQRKLQMVSGRYVSYNDIMFYAVVAKSGEGQKTQIHHIAATQNNGKILIYEGSVPINEFKRAIPVFARQISSFRFTDPYKPNVRVDKYKAIGYHGYKLAIPVDWHVENENICVRFSLNGAEIVLCHAANKRLAQQHAVDFTQRVKQMDASTTVGKARQLPGIEGWETILMRSPDMKHDSETWMRAEYLYTTLIRDIATQTQAMKVARKREIRKKRKVSRKNKLRRNPTVDYTFLKAAGGIGRWASDQHPAMQKCRSSSRVTCVP